MDCSKSTELYEQSAEQLAEEEKKRADARKMKSEFHRTEDNPPNYYDNQNVDYDGRQNGRTNPFGQSAAKQNQIPERQEEPKSAQHFGPNNVFDARDSGRYFQESNANALRTGEKTSPSPENSNQPSRQRNYQESGSNYQTVNRQRNQLADTQSGKFNYEHGNKFQDTRQNYQNTLSNEQDYRAGQNSARNNEKPGFRNPKSRTSTSRNNLIGSNQSQKATPTYMETTTFRTTTSAPPREFQQFAESAAFVSNRNRFSSGNRQYYFHTFEQRDHPTVDYSETTTLTPRAETVSFTPKTGAPPFPGPTFAPIYKPKTTTLPPYETTLQYTPTTETSFYSTSFYRQNDVPETTYASTADTTTVTPFSAEDYATTLTFALHSDFQTPPAIGRVPPAANYQSQQHNRVTEQRDTERDTVSFATTRPYVNTESYRQGAANVTSTASQSTSTTRANHQSDNSVGANVDAKGATRDPWRASSQNLRQNSISSTEKPWKSTNVYQQNGSTSKTLSPYDTSFTYQQGKVLSTLGPYVPFTKNYVYSTMTSTPSPKQPATVPSHSSTLANYRTTANNLKPKVKSLSSPATSKPKDRATYLPEASSKRPTTLEDIPYAEREHALSMLQSLQGLENGANSLGESDRKGASGRNVQFAPGPSTLHSLALYFATAGDNFDSNETVESRASVERLELEGREGGSSHNASVDLPTSILTQHTITSYAELFNLNNALEGNATVAELAEEADDAGGEIDDDLEIEQSEGPLNGAKRSNSTKLRELAQVFTHALSAYLQDPDTFKRVLTEIRPTEPPPTTTDNGQFETTTLYPTTAEEYSSVTKEKDEVLDFSDDTDAARRRKTSTIYPTTLQPPTTTDRSYSTYFTTPNDDYLTTLSNTRRTVYYPSTTLLPPGTSYDSGESSTQGGNTFAFEVNSAFTTTANYHNDIQNYDGDTRDSTDLSPIYDNYFPLEEDTNRNKIGGFHNNTARNFQPYGKNVKPPDATPISNYVASSTPSSFAGTTAFSWGRGSAGERPVQNLTPPHYQRFGNVKSFEAASNSIVSNQIARSTTPLPKSKSDTSSTAQPFRIRYYESTTLPSSAERKTNSESLVTARSSYMKYRNNYNRIDGNHAEGTRVPATTAATTIRDHVGTLDPVVATISDAEVTPYTTTVARATSGKATDHQTTRQGSRHSNSLNNDHWTSSPMVTQLWETTVFVDPRHINHGLQSRDDATTLVATDNAIGKESTTATTTARSTTRSAERSEATRVTTSTPRPWKWAPNDNDSPVAFTLLPTTYAAENTATPTPIITTRSSITTTITSSVTSTNARDNLVSTLLPLAATNNALNATENEVIKAHEMFGQLNETSSNTLMRVMKQADSNAMVRQLVLLLISHCNGPRNKTTEQEKEQLLDALLRMPVNEFSSEESREIIAGISRLSLPFGTLRRVIQ